MSLLTSTGWWSVTSKWAVGWGLSINQSNLDSWEMFDNLMPGKAVWRRSFQNDTSIRCHNSFLYMSFKMFWNYFSCDRLIHVNPRERTDPAVFSPCNSRKVMRIAGQNLTWPARVHHGRSQQPIGWSLIKMKKSLVNLNLRLLLKVRVTRPWPQCLTSREGWRPSCLKSTCRWPSWMKKFWPFMYFIALMWPVGQLLCTTWSISCPWRKHVTSSKHIPWPTAEDWQMHTNAMWLHCMCRMALNHPGLPPPLLEYCTIYDSKTTTNVYVNTTNHI